MTSDRSRLPALAACLVACLVLAATAACGADEDDRRREVDEAAAAARAAIDALAAEIGTDPGTSTEVTMDSLGDCVPGDGDSGTSLVYSLRVTVGDDVVARLPGIAAAYEDDGWDARLRGDHDLQLRGEVATMGATVHVDEGQATVSGESPCIT